MSQARGRWSEKASEHVVAESIGGGVQVLATALFLTGLCTCLQQDPALYRNSYRSSSLWDPTGSAHLDDQISDTPPPCAQLVEGIGLVASKERVANLHCATLLCMLTSAHQKNKCPFGLMLHTSTSMYTRTALDCCAEK